MPVDEVVERIAAVVVVVHETAVGVEHSYVLDRSAGSDGMEQGTAGIGIEAENDTVEQQWMVQNSEQSSAEAEEVAVGTEVEQQMERELGTIFAEGTADAVGRTDQLCVD